MGGRPDNEAGFDQDPLGLAGGLRQSPEQGLPGCSADDVAAVVDRGDGEVAGLRDRRVVVADHRDVVGDRPATLCERCEGAEGHGVVRGEDRRDGAVLVQELGRCHELRRIPAAGAHPTFDDILVSDTTRDDYLLIFEGTGVSIAGLNCNGNPLHPTKTIGDQHAEDIRRSIRLADRLGQDRVVTMSGLPGGEPGSTRVNWVVNAWNSAALEVLDDQWEIAAAFWTETNALAADLDVKVASELHPQNIVFNTVDVYS